MHADEAELRRRFLRPQESTPVVAISRPTSRESRAHARRQRLTTSGMSRESAELDSFAVRDSRARQREKRAWGKSQARDFHLRGCRCGAAFQAKGTTIAR